MASYPQGATIKLYPINIIMKIDFLKKNNSFKKKNFSFNPSLYWRFALVVVFSLLVIACIFGYSLFVGTDQESIQPALSDGSKAIKVDIDRIDKALNYFSDRETKSNQIINSPAPVVDPSL